MVFLDALAVTGKHSAILLVEAVLDGEKLLIAEDDVSQHTVTKLSPQEAGLCQTFGLRCCAEQLPRSHLVRTHP